MPIPIYLLLKMDVKNRAVRKSRLSVLGDSKVTLIVSPPTESAIRPTNCFPQHFRMESMIYCVHSHIARCVTKVEVTIFVFRAININFNHVMVIPNLSRSCTSQN